LLIRDKRKYSDRKQYLIRAVHKRRKKIRQMSVEYKGGRCERCGYGRCIEALEFHHVNSAAKDFNVSQRGYTRSWKRVVEELDKCMMLCANCHREIHAELAASGSNARVRSGLSQGNRNGN
jgi:5-methylcytosine-specific restriction endonuclease McrA